MSGARGWTTTATALFVLWGLLHLGLGVSQLAAGASGGMPEAELASESLLYFVSVTVFGAQAVVVALTLNRVNSRAGYWLNVVVLGVVDLAFLWVLVLPGHVDLIGGTAGPVVWLLASAAATVAQFSPAPAQTRTPSTTTASRSW